MSYFTIKKESKAHGHIVVWKEIDPLMNYSPRFCLALNYTNAKCRLPVPAHYLRNSASIACIMSEASGIWGEWPVEAGTVTGGYSFHASCMG
jgi:hypothetical protein